MLEIGTFPADNSNEAKLVFIRFAQLDKFLYISTVKGLKFLCFMVEKYLGLCLITRIRRMGNGSLFNLWLW